MKAFLTGDRKVLARRCVDLCATGCTHMLWLGGKGGRGGGALAYGKACSSTVGVLMHACVHMCVLRLVRCKESAINQLGAVFRAREAEGLTMDANILSISNVEVSAAKVLAKGPAVLIVSSMVQQINCITNAKVCHGGPWHAWGIVLSWCGGLHAPSSLVWPMCAGSLGKCVLVGFSDAQPSLSCGLPVWLAGGCRVKSWRATRMRFERCVWPFEPGPVSRSCGKLVSGTSCVAPRVCYVGG